MIYIEWRIIIKSLTYSSCIDFSSAVERFNCLCMLCKRLAPLVIPAQFDGTRHASSTVSGGISPPETGDSGITRGRTVGDRVYPCSTRYACKRNANSTPSWRGKRCSLVRAEAHFHALSVTEKVCK